MRTHGGQTVLRSELPGILAVLQNIPIWRPIQLFTDSLTSLQLIKAWIHLPHTLSEEKHLDIVDTICHEIAKRQAHTHLLKVKAHIGVEGNERVDKTAKDTANDTHSDTIMEVSEVRPIIEPTAWPEIDGIKITDIKKQLRPLITTWLAESQKMGTEIRDKWTEEIMEPFDAVASNAQWRYNGDIPFNQMANIMRTINAQLMCNAQLHSNDPTKHPNPNCPLCGKLDTWVHMATACNHPDICEYRTKRHNAGCKKIYPFIKDGKFGRWLTLMNT